MAEDTPEWQLLGCFGNGKCDPKRIAAASPVSYVDQNSSPMLLIVASEDTLVPYHQTLEMAEKLKSAGVKHELIVLPGINHGFIGKTADQTPDANLKHSMPLSVSSIRRLGVPRVRMGSDRSLLVCAGGFIKSGSRVTRMPTHAMRLHEWGTRQPAPDYA